LHAVADELVLIVSQQGNQLKAIWIGHVPDSLYRGLSIAGGGISKRCDEPLARCTWRQREHQRQDLVFGHDLG
jgi:hypothetical protein